VPAYTEARIEQLCDEALTVRAQADLDRVVHELRAALEEHVRLAKASLEMQAGMIALLDSKARA
jgi:hypothetical protein